MSQVSLRSSENNINFSFNINNYEKYIETKYQYQLIGLSR